jgi:hypothetical protein
MVQVMLGLVLVTTHVPPEGELYPTGGFGLSVAVQTGVEVKPVIVKVTELSPLIAFGLGGAIVPPPVQLRVTWTEPWALSGCQSLATV